MDNNTKPYTGAIGITTTIPVEVVLAAGRRAVDLNNLFITSGKAASLISHSEAQGFPRNLCAWIKGIYAAAMDSGIREVVGVIEGDCSNTRAMADVLAQQGVRILPFSYPYSGDPAALKQEIRRFMTLFGVTEEAVENVRQRLMPIRHLTAEIDRLTWQEGRVTGFENHLHLVSCSDFDGDPESFEEGLRQALKAYRQRPAKTAGTALGYIGVPPMTADLYSFTESRGARIVYNEVQREFSFPRAAEAADIYMQYQNYTYPFSLENRIEEIRRQISLRGIRGILHYSQTFCHRAVEDIILKKQLGVPVLSITADRETALDARTRLRLEAFLDMLQDQERGISV